MKQSINVFHTPINRVEEFKALRLEGLQKDPKAFGSSYEIAKNALPEYWLQRATASLVAECEGQLVGTCSFYVEADMPKAEHVAHFIGMYVKAEFRGQGIASLLMQKQIDLIRQNPKIKKIRLGVGAQQAPARALYEKMGFQYVGLFKEELCIEGVFYDEYFMELYF